MEQQQAATQAVAQRMADAMKTPAGEDEDG
jgi:hypothetical protein